MNMNNKMDAITQHSSQSQQDNLGFILQKQPKNLRKISDFYNEQQKSNFCFTHSTQSFTVTRAYINTINDPTIRLYYTKFTPKQKFASICIIHGYGQSSDDYIETASYFAKRGYTVNMIDLRGFGYSGGFRVNNSVSGLLADISVLLTRCCQNGVPTYILCHGLGCLLVFALLQQNPNLPLSGVITLSPLFNFPNLNKFSLFHQILLSFSPSLLDDVLINNMINPTGLTNNPLKIKKLITGVFNFQYVTLKMFKQYNNLTDKVKKDSYKFKYPILMCLGSNDYIQPNQQAQKFIQQISIKQRQIVIFQNGYHQLYNDVNAEDMFKHIQQWMQMNNNKQNRKVWNSKVSNLKIDFLKRTNYIKKFILMIIGILIALLVVVKKIKKCVRFFK